MEPVRPRKESRGSKHSSFGSPQSSRPSSSRGGSRKSSKSLKESPPVEPLEKEVTFDAELDEEPVGYVLPSDSSDEETEETENVDGAGSSVYPVDVDDQDFEPQLDEEAVKAELGGDEDAAGKAGSNESKENKTTEDEEEEVKEDTKKGKRAKKMKRKTEKRKTYDGREVVFVTEFTQTDWKWKDKSERTGKAVLVTPSSVKPESRERLSTARTEEESVVESRTGTDLTPFSLQPNDEFGIPVLDMSSDSDSSEDDRPRKAKAHKHHLPTIGPPQILKYIRESDRVESSQTDKTSSDMDDEFRQIDSTDFVYDEQGNVAGMFSGPCEFCHEEIRPFPTLEQQLSLPPESLYCCEDYREFVEFAMNTANRLEEDAAKKNEKISIKVHAHHGSKHARKVAKEQAVQRMRERELQRRQQEATGIQQAFYQLARQMKTINYQLSSQKCLEEGWTLRAPSPLEPDDTDCEVFVPEPLHPAMIATGKVSQRRLIEKFYPDGSKFLTMFPDGTGNVFYPSGNAAILIISLTLGQYTYIVQDDDAEPEILAIFEPNGYGCCYFGNGKVRLTYDQVGGLELDYGGGRRRGWNWRDQDTHVHAPPFQPIVFGLNRYIGVRFMAQESIALTLTGRKRSCRFNVGSRLKLVNPANLPSKEIDENQLFIDERKIKVDHILNKVSNLLKFPKSPKVDRLLPPLSLSSRQQKVDKLKQEYAASLTVPTGTPGRKKKVVRQTRLSPIPFVSVN